MRARGITLRSTGSAMYLCRGKFIDYLIITNKTKMEQTNLLFRDKDDINNTSDF